MRLPSAGIDATQSKPACKAFPILAHTTELDWIMLSTRDLTIYFDLTTSVSWGGVPVGITRVEREIARRAKGRTRFETRYCFFHEATNAYYELQPEFAAKVLSGEAWVDLDVMRSLPLDTFEGGTFEMSDLIVGGSPAQVVGTLSQKISHLSLSEIMDLRSSNPLVSVIHHDTSILSPVGQLVRSRIDLCETTLIINGGLDWEYKNLRKMRQLKESTGFLYVVIIYDIIPLIYPHFLVSFYVDLLRKYFGELFWTADFGLCISATTRKDVENYLQTWRMPALPMADWPLGSDVDGSSSPTGTPAALPSVLQGRPFLLYVSTIEPRKSHRTIVEAFERGIVSGDIGADAVCVFVGRIGWNCENLIHEIRTNPLLVDRIIMLTDVSDEDLVRLYQEARFVVFPSLYEGYGLSLVEAMALGKACISGPAGSLREVGGEAPLYIDPFDRPRWAEALASAFGDDAMIAELETRSRTHYKRVSWNDSADLFYAALDHWLEARA